MGRISQSVLLGAIKAVQEMTADEKLRLADEIFSLQPNLLGAVLALRGLGVPAAKQEFALEMLLLCFQAMMESGLTWPLITVVEQENQMQRHTTLLRFFESLDGRSEQKNCIREYIDAHPEPELLAWVMMQSRDWLLKSAPEESDKYVLLAVANFVSCIAYVPLPVERPPRIQ
jgi:hypothetical protein